MMSDDNLETPSEKAVSKSYWEMSKEEQEALKQDWLNDRIPKKPLKRVRLPGEYYVMPELVTCEKCLDLKKKGGDICLLCQKSNLCDCEGKSEIDWDAKAMYFICTACFDTYGIPPRIERAERAHKQ